MDKLFHGLGEKFERKGDDDGEAERESVKRKVKRRKKGCVVNFLTTIFLLEGPHVVS